MSIPPPADAVGARVNLSQRVTSLVIAALVFVAVFVAELATLTSVPATADTTLNPVTAYVTNQGSGIVTPIDVATNTPGTPIPVGNNPRGIAVTPDGKTAYVTNQGSGTVTPIDLATNTPGTPISVGNIPSGVAVTPDGKTVYVTNNGSNTVTPIAVATNSPGTPIPVDTHSGLRLPPAARPPTSPIRVAAR